MQQHLRTNTLQQLQSIQFVGWAEARSPTDSRDNRWASFHSAQPTEPCRQMRHS